MIPRLILALALIFAQVPEGGITVSPSGGGGANTWTNVQTVKTSNTCSSCTSLSLTVASTGSNHLLVAAVVYTGGTTGGISSISGGGTWTIDTNCVHSQSGSFGGIACAYVPCTSSSGATSIAFTFSASNNYAVVFYEDSASTGSCSYDTSNYVSDPSQTSQPGVALTLTGTKDALFQFADAGAGTLSISSPYTLDLQGSISGTYGFANDINGTSGSAPTWTISAANYLVGGAIAFK